MKTTLMPATTIMTNPIQQAADAALSRIAPLWPLSHFVAVNPYVGMAGERFGHACGMVQRAVGRLPLQPPADYLAALHDGTILVDDLTAVAADGWSADRLIAVLERAQAGSKPLATFADHLDSKQEHAHWAVLVVEEVSKWCAVAYDDNQTTWNSPWKAQGLFAGWRDAARHDRSPEANGLRGFREFVDSLPKTPAEVVAFCMQILEQPDVNPADFMHRQLMTVSGWAGHIQYRVHQAMLGGGKSDELRELLAIRLAYDAALHTAFVTDGTQRSAWRRMQSPAVDENLVDALAQWQLAYEFGYQRQLAGMLGPKQAAAVVSRPQAQAVFCIDVRSERMRRHLEAALPGMQTIGFAGFFGFAISHQQAHSERLEARCPVLLAPPLHCPEPLSEDQARAARIHRKGKRAWKAFQNSAASCFSFVESMGLGYVAKLAGIGNQTHGCGVRRLPALDTLPVETLANMAEGALRNMSLTDRFARLVLICGHGSHSANNPYASALDCGACGGHAGDVNARLAAAALNDAAVRSMLAARGIDIPSDTVFVAGMHDTLDDSVRLFDADKLPASHHAECMALRQALKQAGDATRRERADALGVGKYTDAALAKAVAARGNDISQVRPEWGLANNAALVVAPRSRTAGLNLKGRVFLHDYDATADADLKVLTLILSAPVVVASWINLQYYASRVDPEHFGSGDKVLHNVLGGIGVMEGNAGDLRNGLPMQSIHDGEKFVHEPRRLSVFIEADRGSITQVLSGLPDVRRLFDHGWIHLWALEAGDAYRYRNGVWLPL